MKTLILKKECKGYYTNQIGNIRISVSGGKMFSTDWQGLIENLDESNEEFIIYKCSSKTKSEVINQLVEYILNNF